MFVAPWLSAYQRTWFKADLVAGLTAAAIVIPKAMAMLSRRGASPNERDPTRHTRQA